VAPLRRRIGRTAEEAHLRARLELARALGDATDERATGKALARRLASRDVELDAAIELATRILASGDGAAAGHDAELRHQLSTWLEGLGEPGLAASELRKSGAAGDAAAAYAALVRIGVLHARAGDAFGAQEALSEAAELEPTDALPLELLGAIAEWAPDAVSPRSGAEAYVHAAKRRARAGDGDAEMENLYRAFELDPSSPLAAAALVAAHAARNRSSAADEVLRAHALALVDSAPVSRLIAAALEPDARTVEGEAAEVHARRREQALEQGDLARALSAALDEGLDATFEGASADVLDAILVRAGAFDALAARLEIRAELAHAAGDLRAAARRWAELGRLLSGPLAAPERATEAYARSVAADATSSDAVHALRAVARSGAAEAWLVEGLVRGALGGAAYGGSPDVASRIVAARTLADVAEGIGDAALARWAHALGAELDASDERARSAAMRDADAARRHEEEVHLAERALESSAEAGRVTALRELARLLRASPGSSTRLAEVLGELAVATEDDAVVAEALRVYERVSDFDGVVRLCRGTLARGTAPPRLRLAFVAALRRARDVRGAVNAAAGLFDACTPWAYSVAWITAAVASDRPTRARALAALAPSCSPQVVAALAAVAAEELVRVGDVAGARRAAEQACRADAQDARAVLALAACIPISEGVVATTALEHAVSVAGASAALATRLADAYEGLGDARAAIAWARRAVALRPGDAAVMEALLERASRAGDAESLADALAWLLPQPQPARTTAERFAPALRMLSSRDAARATLLARRALDVLGPRHASLRSAIETVAQAAGDAALRARLVERWIAAGAPAAERGPLLLTVAEHHAAVGDVEGELLAYVRAARAGVDLTDARARLDVLAERLATADAELAWLEANAERLLDEGQTDAAAAAFRDLGAALWDMADDRPRALSAWLRAAQLDSARGYSTLRRDLETFADARYAVDCLSELVEREGDRARAGMIATEAARAALESGASMRALALARTAIERHPSYAEGLAIAEAAATRIGRMHEVSPIYDQAARGALGRFGRRAAHHRAARFFEASVPMLALKHAAQAFIAVPSEGTTLALLARTADKAQRRSVAVRTVEHVAELARSHAVRAGWLLRAATLTARDLEGARQRVDLLLKALVLSAAPATLSMLAVAARELVSLAPDDAETVALRLDRASESLGKALEGPDGARIAITFAVMALELFSDAPWAWRALERALAADADVDEYVRLLPFAESLARAEGAQEHLASVVAACEKPYANVGIALLRLVGAIAAALGDSERSVRAYVRAAEKEPDDDLVVVEADAAIAKHADPGFVERLSKKIGAYRRAEALRAVATKHVEAGDPAAAIPLLERAVAIAPAELRDAATKELKDALLAAGRGEEAMLRDVASPDLTPEQRAERWTELARMRGESGDAAGATDALLQAATDAPSAARWEAVERAAETSGREHIRVQALEELTKHVDGAARLAVQKRLARAEGARGSLAAAEQAWRKVLELDSSDVEADVAIEALLVARSSYDDLAEHLARRAERLSQSRAEADRETLRAVRLRRAAILEQRLGRFEDAASELEQLLAEAPGHASALRWLADLHERAGATARALNALEQLASTASDPVEQEGIALRRVRALVAANDVDAARRILEPYASTDRFHSAVAIVEARVALARTTQEPTELGAALEDLARVSPDDARTRSEMLVEAAQAAARAGDSEASLARARDAARLAPDVASTQLFARGLEYRLRGAGSEEDAKATISALSRLAHDASLEPEDIALRAFLLAEAEDIAAPGSGERTLRECLSVVGAQPLVVLGLAERAAATGRFEEAVTYYAEAVYGNLLGLRRPGRVALAAADAAERLAHNDAALRFLNEAAKDAETRVEALRRLAQVSFVTRDVTRARSVLRGLADALEGRERAEVLAQLARALFDSESPAERLEADRTLREAIDAAPPDVAERLRAQLDTFRTRPPGPSSVPRLSSRPPSETIPSAARLPTPPSDWGRPGGVSEPPPPPIGAPTGAAVIPQIPRFADAPPVVVATAPEGSITSVRHPPLAAPTRVDDVPTPIAPLVAPSPPAPNVTAGSTTAVSAMNRPDPLAARVAEARAKIAAGAKEEAEKILSEALRDGSIAAADALDGMLSGEPSRSAALLKVRRQAVELRPGDMLRLVALRDAARLDQNPTYVRAIEHVLNAFGTDRPAVAPPPLSAQSTQPGMLTLLTRHSREPAGEAFAAVWEGAQGLFAKSPTAYGMTGLERVAPGPVSPLSRLYEVALRLLDTPRFALFHRRSTGPLSLTVALLAAPSAILAGDAREDSREVRWMFGHALAAVLPQNALPLGLPEQEARTLWDVLATAFGGSNRATKLDAAHARLAEMLWQALAPRTQRRLKDLLAEADATPLELVIERAKQSGRRVGMFLTGDFEHAARAVVAEHSAFDPAELTQPDGLARICAELPALADLYRLAVRPEYADARWRVPAPASARFATGGVPPV